MEAPFDRADGPLQDLYRYVSREQLEFLVARLMARLASLEA
jgi:hypothetical protein|tara:strand:+ start:24600 stop:24722 length:123 start_codon:yes stop_codon:yes gene_type:complete